jgi:hypothetical protein
LAQHPDWDLDRHENEKSDPDWHQNDADGKKINVATFSVRALAS